MNNKAASRSAQRCARDTRVRGSPFAFSKGAVFFLLIYSLVRPIRTYKLMRINQSTHG